MVRYSLEEVTDTMVLGESIFLPTGELLLGAGFHIKKRYRDRLKELGYASVLVEVEGTEGAVPTTTVSESTQREMLVGLYKSNESLAESFDTMRRRGLKTVEDIIKHEGKYVGKFIMGSGIAKALEQFVQEIMNQNEIVLNLTAMQRASDALFMHTMNVTITSLCIGRKYHFAYDELKQLAIGALSYDLGLVTLPPELFAKEELTDQERALLRQHTSNGYHILSHNPAIPPTSAAAALQHHEHQDGTGYPRGTQGENRPPEKDFSRQNMIHRFAEIVAVADKYDMMTQGRRHYSKKLDVREAIRRLIQMGGEILNSDIVKSLVSIVPVYPVGARIRIVDAPSAQLVGYTGVVARDNAKDLEKPQIILFENRKHQKSQKPILIDLAVHSGFRLEVIT